MQLRTHTQTDGQTDGHEGQGEKGRYTSNVSRLTRGKMAAGERAGTHNKALLLVVDLDGVCCVAGRGSSVVLLALGQKSGEKAHEFPRQTERE